MKKIIEVQDIPENEKIFLVKDAFGYRIVNPIRDPDGKLNYYNLLFGGRRNFFMLMILFVLLLFLYVGINEMIANYKAIAKAPCDYCSRCGGDKNAISIYNLSVHTQTDS